MPIRTVRYYTREELENSPTRKDGIDPEKEKQWRRLYVKYIFDAAQQLKMPPFVVPTAAILCHRFFAVRSMKRNDKFIIATACLFLSGKVDDCPRQLNEVIRVFFNLRYKNNEQYRARLKDTKFLEEFREQVLTAERAILYAVGFDFNVEQPHNFSIALLKQMNVLSSSGHSGAGGSQEAKLPQITTNFVNDSLRNTLTLQYKAETLAKGAIYVAAKLLKLKLPQFDKATYCETWNMNPQELDDINVQLLENYETSAAPPKASAPAAGSTLPLPPPPPSSNRMPLKELAGLSEEPKKVEPSTAHIEVSERVDGRTVVSRDSPGREVRTQNEKSKTFIKQEPQVKEEALEEGELNMCEGVGRENGEVAGKLEDSANEDGFLPSAAHNAVSPSALVSLDGLEETSQIKVKPSSSPVNGPRVVAAKRSFGDAFNSDVSPAKRRSPAPKRADLHNVDVTSKVAAAKVVVDFDPFA